MGRRSEELPLLRFERPKYTIKESNLQNKQSLVSYISIETEARSDLIDEEVEAPWASTK